MCYLPWSQLPAECTCLFTRLDAFQTLNRALQVLGRASEVQSFVKIGQKSGYIEIELKGPAGKPNVVIKRTLNANSKSSQFYINGKNASGKEVNTRIQELNIQVSNLWYVRPLVYATADRTICPALSFPRTELQNLRV